MFLKTLPALALPVLLTGMTALPSGTPARSSQAALAISDNVMTLKGAETQNSSAIKFAAGVYIIARTSGEGFISFTVKDKADEPVHSTFFNEAKGAYLLPINENPVKAGEYALEIMGTGAWTVTVARAQAGGASALPLIVSGAEMTQAVSKPFRAAAGKLAVTYVYKNANQGTGTLSIYDVATGKALPGGLMYAGQKSGTLEVPVPAAGVYIAQTGFPLASGGGEVKIIQ
jgi:hypothetical protein